MEEEINPELCTICNLGKVLFGGMSKCDCGVDYVWKESTSSFSDALRADGKIGWYKELICPKCGRIIDEKFIKFITPEEFDNWIERDFPWQRCDNYGYISGNLVDNTLVYGSKNKEKCRNCKNFEKCKRVLNNMKNG